VRLISFIDGERGYCTLVDGAEGGVVLRLGAGEPLRAESPQPAEEGRAGLDSDAGSVEVSWSPAGPMLEFGLNGSGLSIYPVAASGSDPAGSLSGPGVACDLPDGGWSAARSVWAITAKSRLIVLVALRPEDSREHGEEVVGAARIMPGEDPLAYVEPLLSTEYDEAVPGAMLLAMTANAAFSVSGVAAPVRPLIMRIFRLLVVFVRWLSSVIRLAVVDPGAP